MEHKNVFNGSRLKAARQLRGLSITALSQQTEISKQSISLYENGDNKPEYERGIRLANALNVPYSFFLQKDTYVTKTEATYFRSLMSTSKLDRTAQSLKIEYVAKMYRALGNYIDFPSINLPDVDFSGTDDEFNVEANSVMLQEIESIAGQVRNLWGLGNGPINDLEYHFESNGILVTGFDTDANGIDAFSTRIAVLDDEICIVAVDQGSKPECRIRFDLSHELAHILLHPWSEDLDCISKEEFKSRESQANIFASAFLLPRDSFGQEARAYPTDLNFYEWLKKKWKVSIQAMIYRTQQLGIITTNQYQYLMRQISKKGWRKREPGDTPYFLGETLFQGAINLLKEEGVLSVAGILELFSNFGVALYPTEIEKLLHLEEGTLKEEPRPLRIIKLKDFESSSEV